MKEIGEKVWTFINKYKIWIFLAIISILALCLRFSLFSISSGDYEIFLSPWFEELKARWRISCTK